MDNQPDVDPRLMPRSARAQNGQPDRDDITPAPADLIDALQGYVAQVMNVESVTRGFVSSPVLVRGQLTLPADEAFKQLRPHFEAHGYTPHLKREDDQDAVYALPGVYGKAERSVPWVAIGLFAATVLSVFFVGVQGELFVPFWTAIRVQLGGAAPAGVNPAWLPSPAEFRQALITGLLYAASLLGILGAHEMGHYLVARHHKVHTSPPFFIPLPLNILGTLGAVIAMREPAPNRRIQFDIGIAGPLAGLVVAIPVTILGLMLSHVMTQAEFLSTLPADYPAGLVQEGQSIIYLGMKFLVFREILPSGLRDVFVHPIAFAGWAGFLVTALNLLPIGQLDGGHVLYGLFGDNAQKARWPIIGVLVLLATAGTLNDMGILALPIGWSGWWIWVALLVFLVRNHAPVLDEITGLDPKRKALGVLMLVIFVLIFTPRPLVPVEIQNAGQTALHAILGLLA